jgi:hypothetical protein
MLVRLSFVSAALLALSLPALAADAPNLVGKWTGSVDGAVMVGDTPYRVAEPGKKITFSNEPITFTFDITDQQGARFGGTMSSAKHSETLIGHFYPDNTSGVMLDDDGQYVFTLTAPDTLQVCYEHSKPDSKVIACWTAKRPQ